MKKNYFLLVLLFSAFNFIFSFAADKSRALWPCKYGNRVYVSWRMRASDAPKSTVYKLFADGIEVASLTDKTNVSLSSEYANSIFSLEVYDRNGNLLDSQSDVKCNPDFFTHIKLDVPAAYSMNNSEVTYSPNDCSAYDMDGDGEQEIILSWAPSNAGATCTATAPPILDCYKLDGTRLWRINFGPNVLAGCRFTFLCYDFDGDGIGELIGKTAQGSKDATGAFLQKGAAQGANHYASSVNSSGVITDGGREWITCFDGATGKELQTIDYWPYFNIQSDWDDRPNNSDGSTYGHRGNWFKGCVAFLDVNGIPTPCAVTTRGIYTYSYAAAYHWDGKDLKVLWKHSSDRAGQGIYGQGAHSVTCGDVDNDGFDEIIVGGAALDHDGSFLWSTGLGHGDATHLGEFDPENDGLEYLMVTEEPTAKYDCAMFDAKTGRVLVSKAQTGGDTGRGLILDCDDRYPGSEFMEWSDANLFTCKGDVIAPWHVGTIKNSSINFRLFWDGDLYEEYLDRGHIDKWNSQTNSWDRTLTLYSHGFGANDINSTKYNPNLVCDLVGDWREEAVFWAQNSGNTYLTIFTSTVESQYKLPWLRDDHTYDMAITWQNCGYNQPPHLGYSPVDYYDKLSYVIEEATLTKHGAGSSNQEVKKDSAIVDFYYTWENAETVTVTGLPNGINYTVDQFSRNVYFSGWANDVPGEYKFMVTTVGNDKNAVESGTIIILPAELNGEETGVTLNRSSGVNVLIAPNPTDSEFNVLFNGVSGVVDWEISSLEGRVLSKGSWNLSGNNSLFVIKNEGLKKGAYILTMNGNGCIVQEIMLVK
jgi:rhamnogalacturonan endolyase